MLLKPLIASMFSSVEVFTPLSSYTRRQPMRLVSSCSVLPLKILLTFYHRYNCLHFLTCIDILKYEKGTFIRIFSPRSVAEQRAPVKCGWPTLSDKLGDVTDVLLHPTVIIQFCQLWYMQKTIEFRHTCSLNCK